VISLQLASGNRNSVECWDAKLGEEKMRRRRRIRGESDEDWWTKRLRDEAAQESAPRRRSCAIQPVLELNEGAWQV
jgi:hypothetical protein